MLEKSQKAKIQKQMIVTLLLSAVMLSCGSQPSPQTTEQPSIDIKTVEPATKDEKIREEIINEPTESGETTSTVSEMGLTKNNISEATTSYITEIEDDEPSTEEVCPDWEEYNKTVPPEMTIDKPVIYLYGYDDENATVTLTLDGNVKIAYPKPTSETTSSITWDVEGIDNGTLLVNGYDYNYLFWEGNMNAPWTFKKGFCVTGGDTIKFLEKQLTTLGLTTTEIADFITYWAPQMVDNPYNVMSFQTKTYTDAARLTVTPAATTVLRVFMAWYPSNTYVPMTEQKFNVPARKGKTLVEWGGVKIGEEGANPTVPTTANGTIEDYSVKPIVQPAPAPQAPVNTDPYAQYGAYAQCARDWDSTAAPKCGQTWAQLDAGSKSAAYNHWIGHGTNGW